MREGGDRLAGLHGHDLRAVLTNWPDTIAKAEHPDACARGAGAESGSGYVPGRRRRVHGKSKACDRHRRRDTVFLLFVNGGHVRGPGPGGRRALCRHVGQAAV